MLAIAEYAGEPVPSSPGREGCGESLRYCGDFYFYRTPLCFPKDKPALAMHEGSYMGRQHGEKEWIVVAWDGKVFRVLEHVMYHGAREALAKYRGLTAAAAIKKAEDAQRQREAYLASIPRCSCGAALLRFEDDQRKDECLSCFEKRTGPRKKARALGQ